jgi:hypothetical protein
MFALKQSGQVNHLSRQPNVNNVKIPDYFFALFAIYS